MKKHSGLLSILGLLAALVTCSTPTLADDEDAEKRIYVSPMFSYVITDDQMLSKNGWGGTLSIGRRFTPSLNLELTGFYNQFDPSSGGGKTAKFTGIGAGALIFPVRELPWLFALLALHQGHMETLPGPVPNYRGPVFDSGLGVLYPISFLGTDMSLRAEARYRMDAHDEEKAGAGGDQRFYDGVFNVGLLIPLGKGAKKAEPPVEEAPAEEAPAAAPPAPTEPADSDNDGVTDDSDQCPDTPAGAVVDEKGCERDEDGDGVVDRLDKCPGTPAGSKVDAEGCPVEAPAPTPAPAPEETDCKPPVPGQPITLEGCAAGEAVVLRGVNFEFNRAHLTANAKDILNGVADALIASPQIKIEIGGHSDNVGSDSSNQKLSKLRAQAVLDYLASRGVDRSRMTSKGYGKTHPIASNETEAGRELNRRVEMKVVGQ